MTIPNFLSPSFAPFRYTSEIISDVSSCLTTLQTELVAVGWTDLGGNVYQSPADAAARYMTATFTRTSATRLLLQVSDSTPLAIISREMQIAASGVTQIFYYTGKFHVFVNSLYGTNSAEFVAAWLIDCTPDALASCPYPVVGNGTRNSSGTVDGFGVISYMMAIDNGSALPAQRVKAPKTIGNTTVSMNMASGRGFYDEYLISQNVGGTVFWTGRLCQTLLGPGLPVGIGTEALVPIDDGTMATFKSTHLVDGNYMCRLWMRKA